MKVKARYFAAIREIVGKNEEDLDVPDQTTVRDFLSILSEKYGEPLRDHVFSEDTGELSPHLNFLIDGKNIAMINGAQTVLYEGCAFAIIPPVGGGTAKENDYTRPHSRVSESPLGKVSTHKRETH